MSTLYVNTISPKSGTEVTLSSTITTTGSMSAARFSGSTAQSSVFLGDVIVGAKDGVNANLHVSGNVTVVGNIELRT